MGVLTPAPVERRLACPLTEQLVMATVMMARRQREAVFMPSLRMTSGVRSYRESHPPEHPLVLRVHGVGIAEFVTDLLSCFKNTDVM
jgi:hypothetical protein